MAGTNTTKGPEARDFNGANWRVRNLLRNVDQAGNDATAAGLGLAAIADLLGANGCDHAIDDELRDGLAYAAQALARHVQCLGYDLCSHVEEMEEAK